MSEEFSHGIKMLLARIENFPQEFTTNSGRNTRWYDLAALVIREKDTFSDDERKAVRNALRNNRRREFDAKLLDLLAAQDAPRKQVVVTPTEAQMAQRCGMSVQQFATYKAADRYGFMNAPIKREGGPV